MGNGDNAFLSISGLFIVFFSFSILSTPSPLFLKLYLTLNSGLSLHSRMSPKGDRTSKGAVTWPDRPGDQ